MPIKPRPAPRPQHLRDSATSASPFVEIAAIHEPRESQIRDGYRNPLVHWVQPSNRRSKWRRRLIVFGVVSASVHLRLIQSNLDFSYQRLGQSALRPGTPALARGAWPLELRRTRTSLP